MIFNWRQPSDNSNGDFILQRILFPEVAPFFCLPLTEAHKVKAKRNDMCFTGLTDLMNVAQFLLLNTADGNDRAAFFCQVSFNEFKHRGFKRPEIAVEHVAVKSMHNNRNLAMDSCQPPDGAGFAGMRMDN